MIPALMKSTGLLCDAQQHLWLDAFLILQFFWSRTGTRVSCIRVYFCSCDPLL